MTAQQKLKVRTDKNLHICVGLDTDINKIPQHLLKEKNPIGTFNKLIIENTCVHAAAYKINFAFYEKDGTRGIETMIETISYIPNNILIIGDAKRGDIGNTSEMYAQSIYEHFKYDAATLHPYMGHDSIEPFLQYNDKINFILALTSNPGSVDFEKLRLDDGSFLYQKIIQKIVEWNKSQNCGLVFGATNSDELKQNISSFNNMPILLPGVGAQGGNLSDIASIFNSNNDSNYLVNISRALIYCDSSSNFLREVKQNILDLNQNIEHIN